jgi:hypothetical protein
MLDTLGKVMPHALPGESAYQRDYRIGAALKRQVDDHSGSSLVLSHHDRKAGAEDFVDRVSATHGLAGAADTIVVLSRARHESEAVISVTGRDVPEAEYALRLDDGALWTLDGANLDKAAAKGVQLRAQTGLGDRSAEIVKYVHDHPDGVSPATVAKALHLTSEVARQFLKRIHDNGKLSKKGRGLYLPLSQLSLVTLNGADPK